MAGMTVTAWFKQELCDAVEEYRAAVATGNAAGIVVAALRIQAAKGHVATSFAKRTVRDINAVSP